MTCDAIGASCGCNLVRVPMTIETLGGRIISKYWFLDRVIERSYGMAIMTVFDRYFMHRIMAHPALYVRIAIIVGIHMGKARIPVGYIICR